MKATGFSTLGWSVPGLADELVIATGAERLWIAASSASLERETVWFAEVTEDAIGEPIAVDPDQPTCRPAICALANGGALVVACSPDGAIVGAHRDPGGGIVRWRLPIGGVPLHLTATALGSVPWIAVEVARAGERRIVVAALDAATGRIVAQHTIGGRSVWCRWPALATCEGQLALVWCEGSARRTGTVMFARAAGKLDARAISTRPGEAPVAVPMRDGRVAIAWHHGGPATADDERDTSMVRTLEVAVVELATLEITAIPPPNHPGGEDPRGEDQGWELPALAVDADDTLWLVGRSTQGHHVATRRGDGWTDPAPLCNGAWGGRGRRHALVLHRGAVWLARRAPAGIELGPCPPPPDQPATPATVRRTVVAAAAPRSRRPGDALFGDLHQHTAHSDGCGAAEDLWIAARDVRGLDFAAITDHDRFCRRALGPATWQTLCHVAAELDDPGQFVAIPGYEFTGARHPGPGHKCIYFGGRVPDRVPDQNVEALFAVLRELGGIAVPHHVGWTGGDFAHHDPAIQPVWEICSVHGCYEREGGCGAHPPRADHVIPGQFVRDALDAGLRFGFIGSSDSHGLDWHHGIARWRNPFRSGLAAVVGAELTREGIIEALRARRSYATTGAQIQVRIDVAGAPIGSELPAGTTGELAIEVAGTAPIAKIVMVDPGGERPLELRTSGASTHARAPLPRPDRPSYVYVRIEQSDGEAAWASPYWLG